jgi:polyphosphate kinase 2 (PPK2 family)
MMSKKKKSGTDLSKDGKLSSKIYDAELKKLHVELVKLQEWVVHTGQKIVILFEGRDTAGKGGTIKAHYRTRQSAHLPRHCLAGPERSGEKPDVHSALPAAPACCW